MKFLWFIVALLLIVVGFLAWLLFSPVPAVPQQVSVATTTPQDTSAAGEPLHAQMLVSSPVASSTVGQTFVVRGQAPGNWYFEASFPIQVRDKDGNVIAHSHGQALSDWMTESQVPFSATTTLDKPYKGDATLILLRDNPSGLPENDDSLEVPIVIQ